MSRAIVHRKVRVGDAIGKGIEMFIPFGKKAYLLVFLTAVKLFFTEFRQTSTNRFFIMCYDFLCPSM